MKIKFIILIALVCVTMQSIANFNAIDSVKNDKSGFNEFHKERALNKEKDNIANNSKIPSSSSSSWMSENWLNIVLILSNLSLLLYTLNLKSSYNNLLRNDRLNDVGNANKGGRKIIGYNTSRSDENSLNQIAIMKRKIADLEVFKSGLEREKSRIEYELDEKNNENIELGKIIDDLKFQINSISPAQSERTNEVEPVSKYIITKCITDNDQFYLKESKQKNHTTPYVIYEKDNQYYFKFDETNPSARSNAFNFHNIYMEGYCDGVNIRTDAHTSFEIVNKSEGKLKKVGDKYLVVERIKVNYLGGN